MFDEERKTIPQEMDPTYSACNDDKGNYLERPDTSSLIKHVVDLHLPVRFMETLETAYSFSHF